MSDDDDGVVIVTIAPRSEGRAGGDHNIKYEYEGVRHFHFHGAKIIWSVRVAGDGDDGLFLSFIFPFGPDRSVWCLRSVRHAVLPATCHSKIACDGFPFSPLTLLLQGVRISSKVLLHAMVGLT